jgi:hypothetical protein
MSAVKGKGPGSKVMVAHFISPIDAPWAEDTCEDLVRGLVEAAAPLFQAGRVRVRMEIESFPLPEDQK